MKRLPSQFRILTSHKNYLLLAIMFLSCAAFAQQSCGFFDKKITLADGVSVCLKDMPFFNRKGLISNEPNSSFASKAQQSSSFAVAASSDPKSCPLATFIAWDWGYGRDAAEALPKCNERLKEAVKTHGLRNSLLIAPMPTASTSQILGFNECFEPFTSNLYTRRTLAGEFIVINRYLLADLMKAGLWSEDMKQQIVARNGSVQGIPGINEELQLRYKTSWEMKQKVLIDMAAARGAFICQSQSLNLFVADPTYSKLTSMHFYAWKQGLKTGCYYLRTKAPVSAQQFTVEPTLKKAEPKQEECLMCSA